MHEAGPRSQLRNQTAGGNIDARFYDLRRHDDSVRIGSAGGPAQKPFTPVLAFGWSETAVNKLNAIRPTGRLEIVECLAGSLNGVADDKRDSSVFAGRSGGVFCENPLSERVGIASFNRVAGQ